MAVMANNTALRTPRPGSLYDVLDLILDKGLVIDAYVRVSLVGIELLTVDARVVVASVDTYLRFAEATNRLDLAVQNGTGLPELVNDLQQGGARHKTKGALEGAKESVTSLFGGGDDDSGEDGRDGDRRRRERQPARRSSRRSSRDDDGNRSSRSERRSGDDSGDDSGNEGEDE